MKKTELTQDQINQLNIFTLILECDGWSDQMDIEENLDNGENVVPEGCRSISQGATVLEAQFHAPVNMISLSISDIRYRCKVGIFFLYVNQPERIIEWIVNVREQLSLFNYRDRLNKIKHLGSTIMVAVSTPVSCEVQPVFIQH